MTKEDLSFWKYKRVCIRCHKDFGTDRPERKQRCWACTHGKKKQLVPNLPRKSPRKPVQRVKHKGEDKYEGIYSHIKKHGWTWA